MQKSIFIVLLLSIAYIGQAEPVKDTLYTVKVNAKKPANRFNIYLGTGYRHSSTISSAHYTATSPMSMLNLQYAISQRWSAGFITSYFSFTRSRESEVKHSSTLGLGFKLDYAFVHREAFQIFVSGNLSNQHYKWKYSYPDNNPNSLLNNDQAFVQLSPGFNIGFNWFPISHVGIFGQLGQGLSMAEGGIALRF